MKIIAFDSSLKRSAMAAYDGNEWLWEARSFIESADKAFPDARFAQWRAWASCALDMTFEDGPPNVVIYEVPTTHGQGTGEAQIMLMMTLRELCAVRKIKTFPIYPSHLKKVTTGDGHADKAAMMAAVAARVPEYSGVEDDGGDIADSIAMVLWFWDGAAPSESSVKQAARMSKKAKSTPIKRTRVAKKMAKNWSVK